MSEDVLSHSESSSFRARCRAFLELHATAGDPLTFADNQKFLAAARVAGLAGIPYAEQYGGAGLTLAHEKIWREEKASFPYADRMFIISHGMCLPMINEFGSVEQKERFQADMIAGRTLWSQLFSEPGAGSDVASLQMTAVRDGDEWVLNGQKVWTTYAHLSHFGLLIARTDASLPKHAGISMFVVDLKAPGVEVRQINQIDGGREFNEVYFSDVRVPSDNLVGDVNNGWRLATSMLMYERVTIGSGLSEQFAHPFFDILVDGARSQGASVDPIARDEITKIYILETCKSLIGLRTQAEVKAGKTPGPGGSLGKLFGSVIAWKYRSIAGEIGGLGAVAWEDGADPMGALRASVVNSFRDGIAGGTDEIQRNIIGDRVLGLPREPVVDRDVPFRELKISTAKQSSK